MRPGGIQHPQRQPQFLDSTARAGGLPGVACTSAALSAISSHAPTAGVSCAGWRCRTHHGRMDTRSMSVRLLGARGGVPSSGRGPPLLAVDGRPDQNSHDASPSSTVRGGCKSVKSARSACGPGDREMDYKTVHIKRAVLATRWWELGVNLGRWGSTTVEGHSDMSSLDWLKTPHGIHKGLLPQIQRPSTCKDRQRV